MPAPVKGQRASLVATRPLTGAVLHRLEAYRPAGETPLAITNFVGAIPDHPPEPARITLGEL